MTIYEDEISQLYNNTAAFSNQNFLPEATKNLTYGDILTLVFGVIGIAMAATTVWQNQRTYRNSVLNTMQDEFEAVSNFPTILSKLFSLETF